MPRTCAVPGCNSTVKSKVSFFKPPKSLERRKVWEEALGFTLGNTKFICELHFKQEEVIRVKHFYREDQSILATVPFKAPRLVDHAIPFTFDQHVISPGPSKKRTFPEDYIPDSTFPTSSKQVKLVPNDFIENIFSKSDQITLPPSWSKIFPSGCDDSVFANFSLGELNNIVLEKEIRVSHDGKISYRCYGKVVNVGLMERFTSLDTFEQAISQFDLLKICKGLKVSVNHPNIIKDNTEVYRHKLCPIIILNKSLSVCHFCVEFTRRMKKIQKTAVPTSKTKMCRLHRRVRQQRLRIKKKQECLDKIIESYKSKAQQPFLSSCIENLELSTEEKTTLTEIVKAAQTKSRKGRRYSEHWLLLCLLFHIRSPAGYKFLRNANILPLPAPKTCRNYLRLVDTKCGFDKNFFTLFKTKIMKKKPFQRHGVLLLDEIQVRESLGVNSKNLTYVGLTDFGDDVPLKKGKCVADKATHGLVFMFHALSDQYTQPIGVFASKGPVDGTTIAELIVKAIVLLENAGANVHGVVSDGAQTNRKAWTILGIDGRKGSTKNYFEHPLTAKRRIFMFSDTPHLVKNIRNRLFNKGSLRISPTENIIQWNHFRVIHNEDLKLPANLRVCPKITSGHINLTNMSKMRVKLATQIFSKSVADGLKFYSSRGTPGLESCDGTIALCERINCMFDALNRKIPIQGVKPGSSDFIVLEDSIEWLDTWESNLKDGLIEENQFLTKNTTEGLRVTLHSARDLCLYLTQEYSFAYLLTGKVNQDPLEKFFGTIRIAGGQNDHPATPTFLQLYKLLSVYAVLKPPKYGNCTVTTADNAPRTLLSLEDVKMAYADKIAPPTAMEHLKERLNGLVQYTDHEVDEVLQHDTSFADVKECVVYYITGYLCKQIQKHTKCPVCLQSIRTEQQYSGETVAQLTNLKTYGGLIHPNINFFYLINTIETVFANFVNEADVFEKTLDYLIDTYDFHFACAEHKEEIFIYVIQYYLNMRMKQFSRDHNKENKKESAERRKKSKFAKH